MADEIRAASREVLLISPYFVPGLGGTAALRALASQGANVEVLTNSLSATDVAVVHSGYAKYRKPLLESGVHIYELKSTVPIEEERSHGFRVGSSRASLHTKAAIIDGERVFVGSFNIDPRSAELNCEMGVWIRSRALARALTERFRDAAELDRAFTLRLSPEGKISWIEREKNVLRTHDREPHAGWLRRTIVRILEALPIESLL
jgi:putative cardiolipin synthase